MNMLATVRAADMERIEIVTSAQRLAEIGAAWTALWQERDGLIFQSHAWISAWWTTIPDRNRRALRVGLVWEGERLAAVVPLAVARRRGLRLLEWAAASYVDYGDILLAPDCPPGALRRLWRDLRKSGGFDLITLNRLLPDATARVLVGASCEGGMTLRPNHRQELSFRVTGPFGSGAAWFDGQSKKTRQNYRRGCKALEETGTVNFRLVSPEENLAPILDRLTQLKGKWLDKQGLHSDLFDNSTVTLPTLVEASRDAGLLRVFVLECAGALVAVSLNFVQRNTMMAFVTTYDPDFERGSPGMLLMIEYIRWSIDNGLELVDFLCGAEPFKLRFANQSVTLETVLGTRTLLGGLAALADNVRHRYRGWRDQKIESDVAEAAPSEA